jgi:apolipoprotein N-acyltransferase
MAVLVADVPLGGGGTLVMRWGDWVGWIALVGLGLFHIADLGMAFFETND